MTTAEENPYAGQGAVLLDIGGEVGALVVTMPAALSGTEVELRPDGHRPGGAHVHHPHVAVVDRPVAGGTVPSLVFPEVRQGRYGLGFKESDAVVLTVEVSGGVVTTAAWPD